MRVLQNCARLALVSFCFVWLGQTASGRHFPPAKPPDQVSSQPKLNDLLEANVTAEWEAFKKKDKTAYGQLLAEDFAAVEDDNQGMRTKAVVLSEVDRSVVDNYRLFALTVIPLDANSALVTYEITLQFPLRAAA